MTQKEYIDREALVAEYDRVHVGAPGGARKLMIEAPTADVVEVVRCKDCKWCLIENWDGEVLYGCDCAAGKNDISPDDFCSCGEKKQ
jgi:hypothetical protein